MPDPLRNQLQTALGAAYTLERELGGGGMSRVFVAREEALGRDVVVKVLAPELAEGLSAERFAREIRLAAALQEPHIVPVLTAGVTTDGLPYYTMPYVRGASLRQRMVEGPVPLAEATAILRDAATALEYAHRRGLVHRDIKPENVLLSGRTAVVTDFGIAKALQVSRTRAPDGPAAATEGLTQLGTSLGTPAYMAPEQAAGDPIDHRADVYAWGVVAYELLAGRHPFASKTTAQQLMAAHIAEAPPPLTVPPPRGRSLGALVMRCLEKDPARRPQDAHELQAALETMTTDEGALSSPASRRSVPFAVAAMLGLLIAATLWYLASRRPDTAGAADARTLVVLPFANVGGDSAQQYFSDGLADELTTAVGRIPGLRVASRSSAFGAKIRAMSAQDAGRALGVGTALEGSVRRAGSRIRLSARLVDVRTGLALWSDEFEHDGTDVFAAQDDLTRRVAAALHDRLAVTPTAATTTGRGTQDPEAYDLYLRGRYLFARRGEANLERAAALFTEAVRRDSLFARAYAGLAMVQVVLPQYQTTVSDTLIPSGLRNATRAVSLDPADADAHVAVGYGRTWQWDWTGSEAAFRRAIALEPGNVTAHHWYGDMLYGVGRMTDALAELRQAGRLDPTSAVIAAEVASCLTMLRRYPEAIAEGRRALAMDSTLRFTYAGFAAAYTFSGHPDSALALLAQEQGVVRDAPNSHERAQRIVALVALGRRADARAAADSLARDAQRGVVQAFHVTIARAAVGDPEGAVRWLARSVERRETDLTLYAPQCERSLDPVLGDARVVALLGRMGVQPTCRRDGG